MLSIIGNVVGWFLINVVTLFIISFVSVIDGFVTTLIRAFSVARSRKCPNCGLLTARTKGWACQWCDFPLLSEYYNNTANISEQPEEEAPHPQKASAVEQAPAPEPIQQPVPEPEPEPEPVLEPGAKEATVEELISAYEADAASADAELTNKVINLTGVVTKIEVNDFIDVYYIVLSSAEKKLPQGVHCVFDKKYGPALSQLAREQTVAVQGKYNGSMVAMRMRNCVLVRQT